MQATAQQRVSAAAVEPGIDPVYLTRDDLARTFQPATPYERLLLTNAALAQQRLLRAYELERRVLEKHDIVDLFTEKPEMFKVMARHIAECERIFRRALETLERAQRNRAKSEARQPIPLRRRTPGIEPAGPVPEQQRDEPASRQPPLATNPGRDPLVLRDACLGAGSLKPCPPVPLG